MQLGTHARKALCGAPGAEVHHFQSTHWSKIGVVGPFQADRPAYDRPMNSAKGVRSVPLTEDQGDQRYLRYPAVGLVLWAMFSCAASDLHVLHR